MILGIIQARMGSTRLPGKVMVEVNNQPIIKILYDRISKSQLLNKVVVATGSNKKNIKLIEYMKKEGIEFFCGSETDVLKRYIDTATHYNSKIVVRITADCPFTDSNLVDKLIDEHLRSKNDYTSNIDPATFPDGLDIEVFNFETLKSTNIHAKKKYEREHVTPYMRKNNDMKKSCITYNENLSKLRWTLDTIEDLQVIKEVFKYFYPRMDFSWEEVLRFYESNRKLFEINQHLNRNYNTNL